MEQRISKKSNEKKKITILSFESLFVTNKSFNLYLVKVLQKMAREGKLEKLEERDIAEKNAYLYFDKEIITVKAYIREHDGFKKDTAFINSILDSISPLSFGIDFNWNTVLEQIIKYEKNDYIVIASEFPEAMISAYLKKLGISEGILSKIKILPNSLATIQEAFPVDETIASIVHFNKNFFGIYNMERPSNNLKISVPQVKSLDYNDVHGLHLVLKLYGSFEEQVLRNAMIQYLKKQFSQAAWRSEIAKAPENFKEVFFIFSVIMMRGVPAQNFEDDVSYELVQFLTDRFKLYVSLLAKNELPLLKRENSYFSKNDFEKAVKIKNYLALEAVSENLKKIFWHFNHSYQDILVERVLKDQKRLGNEFGSAEIFLEALFEKLTTNNFSLENVDASFVLIFTEILNGLAFFADRKDTKITEWKNILLPTLREMQKKINWKLASLCESGITPEDNKFIISVLRLKNMGHHVALTEEKLESLSLKAVQVRSFWEELQKNITQIKKCFTEKEEMLKNHMIKNQEPFKFLLQNDLLRSVRKATGVEDFKSYAGQVYKIIEAAIKDFLDNKKDFRKFFDALDFAKMNNEIKLKAETATQKITLLKEFIEKENLIGNTNSESSKEKVLKKLGELETCHVDLSAVELEEEKNQPITDEDLLTVLKRATGCIRCEKNSRKDEYFLVFENEEKFQNFWAKSESSFSRFAKMSRDESYIYGPFSPEEIDKIKKLEEQELENEVDSFALMDSTSGENTESPSTETQYKSDQGRRQAVLLAVSGIFSGWKKEEGKIGSIQENAKMEKKYDSNFGL